MDSIELIAIAKERTKRETGRDSDRALALALGWAPIRLSAIIRGVRGMTDGQIIDLAEYSGIDPTLALVGVRAEQSEDKGSEATPYWRALADRLSA